MKLNMKEKVKYIIPAYIGLLLGMILIFIIFTPKVKALQSEVTTLTTANHQLKLIAEAREVRLKAVTMRKDSEIREIRETLGLLITFRDAGLPLQSNDDIRLLVELSRQVPYGSPFKHGHRYTSMYGPRDEQIYGGAPTGHHKGVDIVPLVPSDTIINATADGTIVDFGYSDTLGKYIVFETEGGFQLKYAHLSTIFYQSDEGEVIGVKIQRGERLGRMGGTGSWSTGPHLHFEVHVLNADGVYVELNPWRIIEFIGGTSA